MDLRRNAIILFFACKFKKKLYGSLLRKLWRVILKALIRIFSSLAHNMAVYKECPKFCHFLEEYL